jgi:putative transposase
MLKGDMALRVKELIRRTCEAFEFWIIRGVVSKDLVHIFVSAPPTITPSGITRGIKGRSAMILFEEFAKINKRY